MANNVTDMPEMIKSVMYLLEVCVVFYQTAGTVKGCELYKPMTIVFYDKKSANVSWLNLLLVLANGAAQQQISRMIGINVKTIYNYLPSEIV